MRQEGGGIKFIDVTTSFRLPISKYVTKFACLQTLKVTCTYAWKNNIGGAVFYLSINCNLKQFTSISTGRKI